MPSTIRPQYVATTAGPIHATVAGEGETLVLLPHGGRSAQMYRHLMPLLAPHCRVIALDPPGTGNSFRPGQRLPLEALAESLHEAAMTLSDSRYLLYGMNGGNKLAAAIASAHPDAVSGLIFAGLTHSIVLSNTSRKTTLGGHPMVQDLLDPQRGREESLRAQAVDATRFPPGEPIDEGIAEAIDRLSAILYRQEFYHAVVEFDLETALRSLTVPLAIVEFATAEEDTTIGRQGPALAQALGARTHATIELPQGAKVSLEDRAPELARTLIDVSCVLVSTP